MKQGISLMLIQLILLSLHLNVMFDTLHLNVMFDTLQLYYHKQGALVRDNEATINKKARLD